MIYISSSCVQSRSIKDAVNRIALNGFKNIELSGGTEYYDGLESDLLELKAKYNLRYICHNYFPPPKEHFVLNIASLDNEVYEKSVQHLLNSLELAQRLGAEKFGLHAGFLIDMHLEEIGNKVSLKETFNKSKAIERCCDVINLLQKKAENLKLYIENNAFSLDNKITFRETVPFLLVNYNDYLDFKSMMDFNLLLDVAHLKVSCGSLKIRFQDELDRLFNETDYIHLSDNNGLSDQNKGIDENSELLQMLSKYNLNHKTVTLEIYDTLQKVEESYNNFLSLMDSCLVPLTKG